ncbi:MAG TPA: hypothetical protein EYP63_07055 [Desulfotomaculum sp.]|nr:hypothetical protein [Desulfotomaculum sp.]
MPVTPALKKVTFYLPVDLLQKLRRFTGGNPIPSLNAGVREALEKYVAELEQKEFQQAMAAAAKDPAFLRDTEEITNAFSEADRETARMIPEW